MEATEPEDILASFAFGSIMREIIMSIAGVVATMIQMTSDASSLSDTEGKAQDPSENMEVFWQECVAEEKSTLGLSMDIIHIIFESRHRKVLIEGLYHVLKGSSNQYLNSTFFHFLFLVRCILRIRLELAAIKNRGQWNSASLAHHHRHFLNIQKAFSIALRNSCPCAVNADYQCSQLEYLVRRSGTRALSVLLLQRAMDLEIIAPNNKIDQAGSRNLLWRDRAEKKTAQTVEANEEQGLRAMMINGALLADSPFQQEGKFLRTVIDTLVLNSVGAQPNGSLLSTSARTNKGLNLSCIIPLQRLWANIVQKWVSDCCIQLVFEAMSSSPLSARASKQLRGDVVCGQLWKILQRAHEASELRMPAYLQLREVADAAFARAFRQLPTNASNHIAKAIAVHFATLLDNKRTTLDKRLWQTVCDNLELVQVRLVQLVEICPNRSVKFRFCVKREILNFSITTKFCLHGDSLTIAVSRWS